MPERTSDRSGSLVETHKGYDPRLYLFYAAVALILVVLVAGLARQQLFKTDTYHDRERVQNQRRILVPGPRGHLVDREGRLLVGNRPRFAVILNLDDLRPEFRTEFLRIRRAYRELDDTNLPGVRELEQIARFTVVNRYLDTVNRLLGRTESLDGKLLHRHYQRHLLLPFVLVDDLRPEEYSRLLEQVPVSSPLQLYTSTKRFYPYGSAAAHTLGYVGSVDLEDVAPEGFPGEELKTFAFKGSIGRAGLERRLDEVLQGETGGTIYRVDPAGYRVNPPLQRRPPVQGRTVVTSLDIDLQRAAEEAMAVTEMAGAAVALDIATGEVLVLASKPDFDLNETAPRISTAKYAEIEEAGGWQNRALQGTYPPGSSFKILTALAGVRSGVIDPEATVDCQGVFRVGNRPFPCHDGHAHGPVNLTQAIERSCNVYFYKHGVEMGPQAIADEARRLGFGEPTGIELPFETTRMLVPDPAWKRRVEDQPWYQGDTANVSIGQGYLLVTPLQMACFVASVARDETLTRPTLLHDPARGPLRGSPIGIPAAARQAILQGMEQVVSSPQGTARLLNTPAMRLDGLRFGGKTGTAQVRTRKGTLNLAWFIAFAPVEKPQIALAVMIEGDTPGEEVSGGRYAGPVAHAILKAWWRKKQRPPAAVLTGAP
jgi:penicillin-binding protein 2